MQRFRKFLLWLGTPPAAVRETKPGNFCRIVSEFALEYRTTRDRVLQQLEKKANHRERSKTRGKMITQVANNTNGYHSLGHNEPVSYRSKEDRADAELRQLLGSDISDTESMRTGTWGRSRKSGNDYRIQHRRQSLSSVINKLYIFINSWLRSECVHSWRLPDRHCDRWRWRDPRESSQNGHAHADASWTQA